MSRLTLAATLLAFIVAAACTVAHQDLPVMDYSKLMLKLDPKAVVDGNPPNTVPTLNVQQYLGRWYQVYADLIVLITFSNNTYCARATYGPVHSDGRIGVHNWERQYNVSGPIRQIDGYAFVPNASNPGQLLVHLDGVPVNAPYWILALGPVVNNEYTYAVVSDEFRATLFVLARNVTDFYNNYNDYVVYELLPGLGFSGFNGPIAIQQEGCTYE